MKIMSWTRFLKLAACIFLLVQCDLTIAQDVNCDFTQAVQLNQIYYISSPGYSKLYTPGVQCRWIATCPSGTNCNLNCTDISLPQSTSCSVDRLLISKTGDSQLASADYYCGVGTVVATSTAQKISVGLVTSKQSPGGKFLCTLKAVPIATTPTPPATCSCGYKKTNRIVGGQETGINEFPMMAGIVDSRIFQIKCGGVILDTIYILTAAHCIINLKVSDVAVIVGEHNVNVGDSPATQGIKASSFIIHPQYNSQNFDYDIAIIELEKNITFSVRVGPTCLPFKFTSNTFAGSKATALGWGTTFFGGPSSDYLQKVDLDIISQASCKQSITTLTNQQMCTYTPGKDSCQDDSGGPLMYTDPSTGFLFNIGIISSGQPCASGQPSINTRVTTLLNWIVQKTPLARYCYK